MSPGGVTFGMNLATITRKTPGNSEPTSEPLPFCRGGIGTIQAEIHAGCRDRTPRHEPPITTSLWIRGGGGAAAGGRWSWMDRAVRFVCCELRGLVATSVHGPERDSERLYLLDVMLMRHLLPSRSALRRTDRRSRASKRRATAMVWI
nr:unnamed protein product [Digitaria exilis]